MKVYVVMSLGRQHLGDYCFLRSEKAFLDPEKAENYLKELKTRYIDQSGGWIPIKLATPHGDVVCFCEAGIFEMDVDD